MKQSLIKISKNDFNLKDFKPSKSDQSDSLCIFKEKMQQMWDMYEEQLQRNFELMQVINRQQQLLQQVAAPGEILTTSKPELKKLKQLSSEEEAELHFEPMHFKKMNELSTYFRKIHATVRADAANSIVNFLYVLDKLGCSAYAEKIFSAADISDPTGFRYISTLRQLGFIAYNGRNYNVKYHLTEKGKQFLEGKIKDTTDFQNFNSNSILSS